MSAWRDILDKLPRYRPWYPYRKRTTLADRLNSLNALRTAKDGKRRPMIKEPEPTTDRERIDLAIQTGVKYGGIDGSHHKTWVINEMLRNLMGQTEYDRMVKDNEGDGEYTWDHGCPP